MKMRSIVMMTMAIVMMVSMLTIWFYPSIQEYMMTNPFWNGLRDFSEEMDVQEANSLAQACAEPETSAVVEIPYAEYTRADLDKLEAFVRDGGILLLADDFGYGNQLLQHLELTVRFSGEPLLDPLLCHKNQWLPRITDFSTDVKAAGIEAIVLNHGTALLYPEEEQCLAWSSPSSFLDHDNNAESGEQDIKGPLAVAAGYQIGRGYLVLLSDPSILINSMVERDDNRLFIDHLMEQYAPGRKAMADISRLPNSPLDESKRAMTDSRDRIAHPYSLIAMVGIIVLMTYQPWKREEAQS